MPDSAGQTAGYTGVAVTGGPPLVRQVRGLSITKLAVGGLSNNAYLLRCTVSGVQVLIDAAAEAAQLTALAGGELAAVITTHRHPDHWGALADVVDATGAHTYAGAADVPGIAVPTMTPLVTGDRVAVGLAALEVRQLPGHTPGSIVLIYHEPAGPAHLFTGDCLFPGGIGRTYSPAEFTALYDAVCTQLFAVYGDSAWVYPGHGNDTTLGAERPQLARWRARGW